MLNDFIQMLDTNQFLYAVGQEVTAVMSSTASCFVSSITQLRSKKRTVVQLAAKAENGE